VARIADATAGGGFTRVSVLPRVPTPSYRSVHYFTPSRYSAAVHGTFKVSFLRQGFSNDSECDFQSTTIVNKRTPLQVPTLTMDETGGTPPREPSNFLF